MDSPDELLIVQREVQAKIGRNLLNYQLIEGFLKYIVSVSSADIRKDPDGKFNAKRPNSERMMLGQLIGKYVSEISISTADYEAENSKTDDSGSADISMRFKFRTIFDDPYQQSVMAEKTKVLVDDRNILVHHFYQHYKFDSIVSCTSALEYLEEKNRFILEQFDYFKDITTQLKQLIELHVEFISSEEFTEIIKADPNDSNPKNIH